MISLSLRLQAVVDMVTPGLAVADIGCDHAYLPIYMLENHIAKKVYACDVNEGPVEIAKQNVARSGYQDEIQCLLGDGLSPVSREDIDCVIIAGMGSRVIIHILEEGKAQLSSVKELVLEPQSEIALLRHYLEENGFMIISENMVCEDGKFYQIMKAVKGTMSLEKEEYYRYGKILVREAHPVLHEYLIRQKEHIAKLLLNLQENGKADSVQARIDELKMDLSICENTLLEFQEIELNGVDYRIK